MRKYALLKIPFPKLIPVREDCPLFFKLTFSIFTCIACTASLASGETPMKVFHVKDFGAAADGQTDDGPAIRLAIDAAISFAKPAKVVFDKKKTYRVGEYADRWCCFTLEGAKDVTLDGRGSTLVFHPGNRAFMINKCENTVIRNFSIDYDPLPYTQGDVIEIDREQGFFIVKLHDGYPEPPSQEFMKNNNNSWKHGAFLDAGNGRHYTSWYVYVSAVYPVPDTPRTYRIEVEKGNRNVLTHVEPGQQFVLQFILDTKQWFDSHNVRGTEPENKGTYLSNHSASIQIHLSKNCLIENINHYMSPLMTFRVFGTDNVCLRNVRITYKPGTNRLAAGLSDGMHCKDNVRGPIIENCLFEGLLDDCINLSSMAQHVAETLGENQYLIRYCEVPWYDNPIQVGDRLMGWEPTQGGVLGYMNVTSVKFAGNRKREITVDKAIPGLQDEEWTSPERCTQLYIDKKEGAVVRNCTFRSSMKTAAVFRGAGLFENNTVEDGAFAVHSENSSSWSEGPHPSNLVIRNNTFSRMKYASIIMQTSSWNAEMTPVGEGLLIEGNTFTQNDGNGIQLRNLRNVAIRDNQITMEPNTPPNYAPISMANCEDITIDGLKVRDTRTGCPAAIQGQNTRREKITMNRLEFDIPKEMKEASFAGE